MILGLTGGLAMGKSTLAAQLRHLGIPVHDADAEVHRLYREDTQLIHAIGERFPEAIKNNKVDRAALAKLAFGNNDVLHQLERWLHPKVKASEERFMRQHARKRFAVLDIPLLFETKAQARVDKVLLVTATPFAQHARAHLRPGMTAQKFRAIVRHQWSDARRRAHADYIVYTGLGLGYAMRQLKTILSEKKKKPCAKSSSTPKQRG